MAVYGPEEITALDAGWSNARLSELMAYIVADHHRRFRVELPALRTSMEKVYGAYRHRDFARLAPLPGLLFLMQDELDEHMRREECTIFPDIEAFEEALESGQESTSAHRGIADLIAATASEHEDIFDRLAEVRRITGGYEAPSYADQAYRTLFQRLGAFEHDLDLHIHLENDVLFSRTLSLLLGGR